jgi:hypothetical protein
MAAAMEVFRCMLFVAMILSLSTNVRADSSFLRWNSRDLMNVPGDFKPDFSKPVPCDTVFQCKQKTEFGEKTPACEICLDRLYESGSDHYGSAEFTEKSPYIKVKNSPSGPEDSEDSKPESDASGPAATDKEDGGSGASGSSGASGPDCDSKIIDEDVFVLPCCKPKKDEGGSFVFHRSNEGNLPCCGGGPACCRWCPEFLCDELEHSNEQIPTLWWHVCENYDTEYTVKTRLRSEIRELSKPPDNRKVYVPPLKPSPLKKIGGGAALTPAGLGVGVAKLVAPGATNSILSAANDAENAIAAGAAEASNAAAVAENAVSDVRNAAGAAESAVNDVANVFRI